MNYIKPFTDIFGIKPGEEFGILFPAEKRVSKHFYIDERKGLMVLVGKNWTKANGTLIEKILIGDIEIRKLKKKGA